MNRKEALEGIQKIQAIIPQAFVLFGTALGAVRERALIAHDGDVDMGVLLEHWKPEYLERMREAGFTIYRQVRWQDDMRTLDHVGTGVAHELTKLQMTYKRRENRFCFDIMARRVGTLSRCHLEGGRYGLFHCPALFVERTVEAEISGVKVRVPYPPEAFLHFVYGPDWREPREKYYWTPEHEANRKRFIIEL